MNYQETLKAVCLSIMSGRVPMVWGPPGVGKTAMAALVHDRLKDRFDGMAFFCANDHQPEEIAGIPAPVNGKDECRRLVDPTSELVQACEKPMLIVVDEMSTCEPSMFKQIRRLLHERKVGSRSLHPGTRFMCMSNPQAQSLMSNDLPLPLLNALNHVTLTYTVEDFQTWLDTWGNDEVEHTLALQLQGLLDCQPDLLEIDPAAIRIGDGAPTSYVDQISAGNQSWASPRAYESALRLLAVCIREKENVSEDIWTGILGPRQAPRYTAMRVAGLDLPRAREISDNPEKAKLPKAWSSALALGGTFRAVQDSAAAWVYLARLADSKISGAAETCVSLVGALEKRHPVTPAYKSMHTSAAMTARVRLTNLRKGK